MRDSTAAGTAARIALAAERYRAGDREGAAQLYRKVLRRRPGQPEVSHGLALIAFDEGRYRDAYALIRQAVEANPGALPLYMTLGVISTARGDWETAIDAYRRAIDLRPGDTAAYNALGRLYHDVGAFVPARACYEAAIRAQPGWADGFCNLGNLHLDNRETEPALGALRRALQLDPDSTEVHVHLAVAQLERRNLRGAVDRFRRAMRRNPGAAHVHGYWAHALLTRGYLREGWAACERGLGLGTRVVSDCAAPFWEVGTLAARSLLVLAEQGVGDQIMFCSCLGDLIDETGIERCVVECDARLIPLLQRTFHSLRFRARGSEHGAAGLQMPDFKIAMGSLAHRYRTDLTRFPASAGYLRPDANLVRLWKARHRALGARRVIGISWRGGYPATMRQRRSIDLSQWEPVLRLPDAAFVNLQYGTRDQDMARTIARFGVRVHDWLDADALNDLDQLAARIAALDLVISVDNCTAHLAGAVGAQVWTLLPFVADWRWMRDREDSPWYPSMTLIRQCTPGDWRDVMTSVRKRLDLL